VKRYASVLGGIFLTVMIVAGQPQAQVVGPTPQRPIAVTVVNSNRSFADQWGWLITLVTAVVSVIGAGLFTTWNTRKQIQNQSANLKTQLKDQAETLKRQQKSEEEIGRKAVVMALGSTCVKLASRTAVWAEQVKEYETKEVTRYDIARLSIMPERLLDLDWRDAALLNDAEIYVRFNLVKDYIVRSNRRVDNLMRVFANNGVVKGQTIREPLSELSDFLKDFSDFCEGTSVMLQDKFKEQFVTRCQNLFDKQPGTLATISSSNEDTVRDQDYVSTPVKRATASRRHPPRPQSEND
jgi:hypothetical protein